MTQSSCELPQEAPFEYFSGYPAVEAYPSQRQLSELLQTRVLPLPRYEKEQGRKRFMSAVRLICTPEMSQYQEVDIIEKQHRIECP